MDFSRIPLPGLQCLVSGATLAPVENISCSMPVPLVFIPLVLGAAGAIAGIVLAPFVALAAVGVAGFGAAGAIVGIVLTPFVAHAAVGVVGFGAAGPVAGVPR